MIVTLITQSKINSITLPEKKRGQFWLFDSSLGTASKLISIEAINGEWALKSNRKVRVVDGDGKIYKNIIIKPSCIYNISVGDESSEAHVFTEASTDDRQIFRKYQVSRDFEINVGRSRHNDIVIDNDFISGNHAKLTYTNGKWSVCDNDSTNGTFVNGIRVEKQGLNIGDVIYMMGFKLIVGKSIIAINNPDNRVRYVTDRLLPYINQEVLHFEDEDDDETSENTTMNYFYRSPRFRRDVENVLFKVDSPPQNAIGDEMPMIMVIGPSMTMGMASMATAIFAINNAMVNGNFSAAMPSIVMSGSMLLGTVMWPILSKKFDKRRRHKKEALRQKKYKAYLGRLSIMFNEECRKQEEILRENFVTIDDCVSRIQNVQRNLWERGLQQNDFLALRTGTGNGLLSAEIAYSERNFTIDEDNLQESLYALCEKPKELLNIPIKLSLFENTISGAIGDRKILIEFAKGLIFQLASLYSYDEVKLVFFYDIKDEHEFEFTKWLPHVWSNDSSFRFIATDSFEAKEVSAYIEREIETRLELKSDEIEGVTPYYVIFAFDKMLADRVEMFKQIHAQKSNLYISVIHFYDDLKNTPKECSIVVELGADSGKLFNKNDVSGKATSFIPDIFLPVNPEALSIELSNVHLDVLAGSYRLPKMLTFLEMYGVGKVEHLNALSRWSDNDPTKSLEAIVGVDTFGELFRLDLHENFHGPHGLVAGMTGSGKSEFIITYILSLAVNYHPNELAFILIDYKGGGMAKSFENLPHTAGIITNLDGAAIKRSLVSIESELKRRQAIFAEASKKIGVSNIDIYKYQRLYRESSVDEPLQHLFIISDEFAELKTQQPEFMTQLVSAARIGRSLGIHLILATQKPAGVVDDQIWSNSKFRICLKVQERADSMDMLKRPDAAELTDTGRFYLQVGYNELFEMGQSSWAGAPYHPSDKVLIEKDNSVVFIDRNGHPIREVKPTVRKSVAANPPKQLDVITEYLCTIANEEKIRIRPLWLEPIPAMILLEDIIAKHKDEKELPYVMNPIVGEYDDPERQQQCAFRVPITQDGNVIIYGAAGSGKATFLNTLIYSLITKHTPDEVNLYLLDFASETLRAFTKAPHVGDVVFSHESEKISNLLKMLKVEIDRRVRLFADYGGDYKSYITTTGESLPNIIVIISNFAAFIEWYEEKEELISYLTREGTKYGLYLILTALGTGAVRFRMLQNFRSLYVLQMNDEADYATVMGKTGGLFPSKHKGRGLLKLDELYEFQIAHVTDDPIPYSFLQNKCNSLKKEWTGEAAPRIPILPDIVDSEFLSEYIDSKKTWNVPIGVAKSSLQVYYYPFGQHYINAVMSAGDEYQLFAYDLATLYAEKYSYKVTFFDGASALSGKNTDAFEYFQSVKDFEAAMITLFEMTVQRHNSYKDALDKGEAPEPYERRIIVFNSIATLKNAVSEEANERLSLILEKGDAKYGITIIFAEQVKNIPSLSFEKWYVSRIDQSSGIWIGNGISEQYQMKPGKTTSEMRDDVEFGFGFALQKGKAVKVKLLCSEKVEESDDE
jgi:S-DNA-T family DNA segregation ATPase FtsK/SpoIIIE